jgi:hypothetical protein
MLFLFFHTDVMMNVNNQDRQSYVILSAAKDLSAIETDPSLRSG